MRLRKGGEADFCFLVGFSSVGDDDAAFLASALGECFDGPANRGNLGLWHFVQSVEEDKPQAEFQRLLEIFCRRVVAEHSHLRGEKIDDVTCASGGGVQVRGEI